MRILEGNGAASLRRIHNITLRHIQPAVPAGRCVWIEAGPDRVRVGLR